MLLVICFAGEQLDAPRQRQPHVRTGETAAGLVHGASRAPWPAAQRAGSPGLVLGGAYLPLMARVLEAQQARAEAQGPPYTLLGRAIRG